MASVTFNLNRPFVKATGSRKTKILNPKETAIVLYVRYPNRKVIKVGTGQRVAPTQWDFVKKQYKTSAPGSLALNNRLFQIKSDVYQAITIATSENFGITLSQLRNIINDVLEEKKPKFNKKTFLEYFDEFILQRSTLREFTTVKKYKSTLKTIKGYLTDRGVDSSEFFFESLDHAFDIDFRDYLIHKRKNLNNTIAKAYEVIIVVIKWGLKNQYHKNHDFESFLPTPRDRSEVIFLELEEIRALEELVLNGIEELARNVFMFAYYTGGQRISDVLAVKTKDIVLSKDSQTYDWHLFQKKGKKTVRNVLPLLDQAQHYIKPYYKGERPLESLIFPQVAEQEINLHIKVVCSKAGINQFFKTLKYSGTSPVEKSGEKSDFISFKVARKSFVSNSLKLGMSPELIIKYTGHSTTKVMRDHYLGISEDFKRAELFKFWQPEKS